MSGEHKNVIRYVQVGGRGDWSDEDELDQGEKRETRVKGREVTYPGVGSEALVDVSLANLFSHDCSSFVKL